MRPHQYHKVAQCDLGIIYWYHAPTQSDCSTAPLQSDYPIILLSENIPCRISQSHVNRGEERLSQICSHDSNYTIYVFLLQIDYGQQINPFITEPNWHLPVPLCCAFVGLVPSLLILIWLTLLHRKLSSEWVSEGVLTL